MTQPNPSPNYFMQQNERNASKTRSPRGRSPSRRVFRLPRKDYLKRTCTNSFCEVAPSRKLVFNKTKSGCRLGEKCSYAHRQVDEQPKKSSKMMTEVQWAMLKKHESYDTTRKFVVYDSSNAR